MTDDRPGGQDLPLLDQLAAEVASLAQRVQDALTAQPASVSDEGKRGSDLQALRNLIALAPFANPRLLPLLRRHVRAPRPTLRPLPPPPPTPPRGIPHPRSPRGMD